MSEFLEGNRVLLLENGSNFFSALKIAIDRANYEIYLETYIFCDDATGRDIANALSYASRRGVAVHLLVDGFGSRGFVDTLLPALRKDGVQALVYRREIKYLSLQRHRLRRLHRKLAVIDAAIAFVGGINIINDYPDTGPSYPRFDYAVQIEGPLLQPIHTAMQRMWLLVSIANLHTHQPEMPSPGVDCRAVGHVRAAFIISGTLRRRREIENAYIAMLNAARDEVIIACAYFFPGRRIRLALRNAAGRGVKITLLLQGVTDHPLIHQATRALYPALFMYGIKLFEYERSELHAKVAVVDGRWSTIGSSNIDPFSLLTAKEANVVIDDHAFSNTLRSSLTQAMAGGAVELHREDWRKLPLPRRILCWMSYQLVRLIVNKLGFSRMH